MERKKLPVGIDSFEKLRREDFYYVDKTRLIIDLLKNWGEVNLFTRPRRFGKTLNMSMLKSFFEIGTDKTLFDGLAISEEKELCEAYMGKFPVVFVSLKGVDGLTFEDAYTMLKTIVRTEASRHYYLKTSEKVSTENKQIFEEILSGKYEEMADSLRLLSQMLYQHYDQKAVLLIDEYDVPLDKAFQHGYYKEMVALIRSLFGQALKTNDYLQFAVLTGCLRVSKESIFTGLNNFKVLSITDSRFDEHFGFTDAEVKTLLDDYNLTAHYGETKEWYDGYRFGSVDVYCPWDVINHVDRLCGEPNAEPQAYWINTSGNDLVRRFVDKADKTTQGEIERLIAGEAIEKAVRLELTYNEIDNSIDNLWSVLFTTGYLTQAGKVERSVYKLIIPNREVREVFVSVQGLKACVPLVGEDVFEEGRILKQEGTAAEISNFEFAGIRFARRIGEGVGLDVIRGNGGVCRKHLRFVDFGDFLQGMPIWNEDEAFSLFLAMSFCSDAEQHLFDDQRFLYAAIAAQQHAFCGGTVDDGAYDGVHRISSSYQGRFTAETFPVSARRGAGLPEGGTSRSSGRPA